MSTATVDALRQLPTGNWVLDPSGSEIRLTGKGMFGLATVKGGFSRFEGEGVTAADGTARGSLTVDAASVDTANTKRDNHLRSNDFFGVETHPAIVFAAERVALDGVDVSVTGQLTVNGTTTPLSFTATPTEATAEAVTLTARITLSRLAHGVGPAKTGMVRDQIVLDLKTRFTHTG